MSSLIEQAAKRLEQLRQAGAEMPAPPTIAPPPVAVPEVVPPPEPAAPVTVSRRVDIDLDMLAATGIISPGSARSQMADQSG